MVARPFVSKNSFFLYARALCSAKALILKNYRRAQIWQVCSDPQYSDWAECVQVDFDDTELSYEDLCRVFFKSHEPSMGSPKRQYMSAIFAHTDEQYEIASKVLRDVERQKTRVSTQVEMATDFYEAEFYHQKWLLQRKADWFKRLDMVDPRELVEGEAASRLNAYVAGYISHDDMRDFASKWVKDGAASQDVFERVSFYLR